MQLERTGPFIPPISFSGPGVVIVTVDSLDSSSTRLLASGSDGTAYVNQPSPSRRWAGMTRPASAPSSPARQSPLPGPPAASWVWNQAMAALRSLAASAGSAAP